MLILIVAVAAAYVKSRLEESLMMRQFPEAYREYRKRTKALIPYIL